MESSFIIGAQTGVDLYKVPTTLVKQTTFVGGMSAMELNECGTFTVTKNIMACHDDAAIKTRNHSSSEKRFITMNQIWEVFSGFHTENDMHDSLEFGCNNIRFSDAGVTALNSSIADQGNSTTSAGNNFYNISSAEPTNYWIQNGGNTPNYYYGPMNATEFDYFTPMSIPTQTASYDPLCSMLFQNDCPEFQVPIGVKKNGEIANLDMSVYPNPSNGAFTLEIKDTKEKFNLNIYDIMGRTIESRIVDFEEESSVKFEIKTRGLYIVSLTNENNRITKKVIVD